MQTNKLTNTHKEVAWALKTIPGFSIRGFKDAVGKLCGMKARESREWMPKIVCDGYVIDWNERRIDVFEVEDTHRITDKKLAQYAMLAVSLEEYEIMMELFVVNRYGHINKIELMPYYLKHLGNTIVPDSESDRDLDWVQAARKAGYLA